jgi:predicted PurR-regulated permease PerM/methylmalonyl-CoA mutase cobalamin-binding subunit
MMLESLRPEPPPEERPRPDIKKLRNAFQGPFDIRSLALTGLFILASFYTLYLARAFFLPISLALLLNFLLSPVVRWLKKLHIPEAISAVLLVFGLLGALGLGIYELAGPAYEWAQQAPRSLRRLEGRLAQLKKPVQAMSNATATVEKITKVGGNGKEPPTIEVQQESLGEKLFSQTTEILASGSVLVILLFFLLASGDMFLRKLIKVLPRLADKKRAVEIARQIENDISVYLATITFINGCLGLATWGAMALLGVPNPLLWGVMAWATNYIPYLGAMLMYATLTMVGFLTFDTAGHALLVPLMHRSGDLWQKGDLRPIHEHMASAVVRSFLGSMRGAYHLSTTAPHLIVTTPARQLHELGALIVAATAASEGWQATYLGPDLPPEEIAAAAVQKAARAVAISIVYPPDDPLLMEDLKRLRRLLPSTTELIVGGRASNAYAPVLKDIGALHVDSLSALRQELEQLRSIAETSAGKSRQNPDRPEI